MIWNVLLSPNLLYSCWGDRKNIGQKEISSWTPGTGISKYLHWRLAPKAEDANKPMDDTGLEGIINTEAYQNNRTKVKGPSNNEELLLSSGSLSFGNNQ